MLSPFRHAAPLAAVVFFAAASLVGADAPRDIPAGRWDSASVPHRMNTPAEPFGALALSWSAACEARTRIRVSADGESWSGWSALAMDEDLSDRSEGRYFTAIAHPGGENRYVEYAFDSSCALDAVTVTLFPPARAAEPRRRGEPHSFQLGGAEVRSRTDWGCPDGQGSRWTPGYSTVTHAIVHHTAGANSVADWEAEMRNIWHFHTVTRGWGDIGYNFLIDPNGTVYEGRAGGNGSIGAHFSCRNTNTVGVALLGTFTSTAPTAAALDSLKKVLAELVRQNGIAPNVIARHVPTALDLWTISGHRDGNPSPNVCSTTECPGNILYSLLPQIRSDVVNACTPITIVQQLASTTIAAGSSVSLTVGATGSDPLSYQWYSGVSGDISSPVADATAPTLTIAPSSTASYWVRISNACDSKDSAAAMVTVGPAAQVPRRRPSRS